MLLNLSTFEGVEKKGAPPKSKAGVKSQGTPQQRSKAKKPGKVMTGSSKQQQTPPGKTSRLVNSKGKIVSSEYTSLAIFDFNKPLQPEIDTPKQALSRAPQKISHAAPHGPILLTSQHAIQETPCLQMLTINYQTD